MKEKYVVQVLCLAEYSQQKSELWKKVGVFDTREEAERCIPKGKEYRFRIYKLGEETAK